MKLSYNPLRQLIEIQDWLGNTRITPDALGRAEKVQYPDGREVSYTYGKAGERRSITYPDGKTVFFVKHFSLKKASEFPVFSEGFSLL